MCFCTREKYQWKVAVWEKNDERWLGESDWNYRVYILREENREKGNNHGLEVDNFHQFKSIKKSKKNVIKL